MAAENYKQQPHSSLTQENKDLFSSYLGLSFTLFLGFLPKSSIFLLPSLQSHNKALSLKLHRAECELNDLCSKRKEDSKANARVVEIFASYRHAWMQQEKRLLDQIDVGAQEIEFLRAKLEDFEKSEVEFRSSVEDLKRDVYEREEMLNFMVRSSEEVDEFEGLGARFGKVRVSDEIDSCFVDNGVSNFGEIGGGYVQNDGYEMKYANLSSEFWAERTSPWQDTQHESLEPVFHLKQFVSRESPWQLDSESNGVSAKLKQLEHELVNLERIGGNDLLKTPSVLRKQAKRYEALVERIVDLCRNMKTSDPYEPDNSSEFKSHGQTEFLVEALRLQQRASETGQKLIALQSERRNSYVGNDVDIQAKLITTRNIFKDVQRKLEIWLARIIGNVEGMLSREVRENYISRNPFV